MRYQLTNTSRPPTSVEMAQLHALGARRRHLDFHFVLRSLEKP